MKSPRRTLSKKLILVGCGFVFLIALWYLVSFLLQKGGSYGLPYPHDSLGLAFSFLGQAKQWKAIGWTLLRLVIGYSISLVAALILGVLAGLFPNIKAFLSPSLGLLKTVPTVAIVVLLVTILLTLGDFGAFDYIASALVFVVAFPLLYEAFASGIANEDKGVLDALELECGRRSFKAITKVLLPDAFPFISLGMAQSLGMSMKVAIMAEVVVSSSVIHPGIGTLILLSRQQTGGIEEVPAYVLIALAMMILIDIPLIVIKTKKQNEDANA